MREEVYTRTLHNVEDGHCFQDLPRRSPGGLRSSSNRIDPPSNVTASSAVNNQSTILLILHLSLHPVSDQHGNLSIGPEISNIERQPMACQKFSVCKPFPLFLFLRSSCFGRHLFVVQGTSTRSQRLRKPRPSIEL